MRNTPLTAGDSVAKSTLFAHAETPSSKDAVKAKPASAITETSQVVDVPGTDDVSASEGRTNFESLAMQASEGLENIASGNGRPKDIRSAMRFLMFVMKDSNKEMREGAKQLMNGTFAKQIKKLLEAAVAALDAAKKHQAAAKASAKGSLISGIVKAIVVVVVVVALVALVAATGGAAFAGAAALMTIGAAGIIGLGFGAAAASDAIITGEFEGQAADRRGEAAKFESKKSDIDVLVAQLTELVEQLKILFNSFNEKGQSDFNGLWQLFANLTTAEQAQGR